MIQRYWEHRVDRGLIDGAAIEGNRTTGEIERRLPARRGAQSWAVADLATQQRSGARLHSATAKE
jgi:hypothetical protein